MIGTTISSGNRFRLVAGVVLTLLLLSVVVTACGSSGSGTGEGGTPVGDSDRGRAAFISKACSMCHRVEGVGQAVQDVSGAEKAPDLTHIASVPLIAGTLERTDENMRAWLSDPQAVKPGTLMPKVSMTEDMMNNIIAFLSTLK